jgi:hypothetical protein
VSASCFHGQKKWNYLWGKKSQAYGLGMMGEFFLFSLFFCSLSLCTMGEKQKIAKTNNL